MDGHGDRNPYCYFHPRELVVGICALCLKERLLILASKQGNVPPMSINSNASGKTRSFRSLAVNSTNIVIPRVFALGSFFHRPAANSWRNRRKFDNSDEESISSLEDSFISVKFEEDGKASWDKKKTAANSNRKGHRQLDGKGEECGKSVVEHRGVVRWKKRFGHLLQVSWWKRSSKQSSCHGAAEVAATGGVKGGRGWIRTLTRRQTTSTVDLLVE